MKKTIIFLHSILIACLLFTACDDPFAGQFVAEPGTNEQQPIIDPSFAATLKSGVSPVNISLDQISTDIALLNVSSVPQLLSSDTVSTLNYVIQMSATDNFAVRVNVPIRFDGKAGSDVMVNASDLNKALLTLDYSTPSRSVYLRMIASVVRGGTVAMVSSATMTLESNAVVGLKTTLVDGVSPLVLKESQAAESLALVNALFVPVNTSAVKIEYQLQVSNTNTFAVMKEVPCAFTGVAGNDFSVKVADLNLNVLKLNNALTKRTVYVRSVAKITVGSNEMLVYSNVMTAEITPFEVALFPTQLYIPGNHNGWTHVDFITNPDVAQGALSGYVYLSGEFKLTNQPDWNGINYGDAGGNKLSETGGNLNVTTPGVYYLTADVDKMTYATQSVTWGLIGSATPGGWDSDTQMTYDVAKKVYTATVTLADGEFKFRRDGKWDVNLGSGQSTNELSLNGGNIPVTAGKYKIDLKLFNSSVYTYVITKQ